MSVIVMSDTLLAAIGTPFIPGWAELRPFVAELWLIAAILGVLLAPFFTSKRQSNGVCGLVALAGLTAAFVSLLVVGSGADSAGMHFRGLLLSDPVAFFWKCLLLLFTGGVVLMWFSTTSATMHEGDGPEFFTLLLGAALGMALMASTSNLLMLVIAVEMASLPSYVLAGFRKTHRVGAEASLKYVLFGAASSSVMVYGLSMLYGLYGTLQLAGPGGIAQQLAGGTAPSALLLVAVLALIVGIGFKISLVPLHFWCPDVFEGASIEVSTFLSVASKGAALTLLLRVLMVVADALGYQNAGGVSLSALAVTIGVLGAITATVGNTAAYVQNNIKRLLAYSSIAHAGYMLCAVSLLVRHNTSITQDGMNLPAQVILLYLAVYLFMNLGAFTVAGLIYRQTGSEDIRDYAGMGRRAPLLAACMAACLFSLIGLPPFAGFVAKVNLLWALIQNGGWWWWLVAVVGLNTIFSLYYYARVLRVMYLEDRGAPAIAPNPLGSGLAVLCSIALVLMLVGFNPLNKAATDHSRMFLVTGQQRPADVAVVAPRPPAAQVAASDGR